MTEAERIMNGMGFAPWLKGPYVDELRKLIERQVAGGLRARSPGTWAIGADLSPEARARSLLAFDWEIEHGHSCRFECFEAPWGWTTNVETWKRSFYIRWVRVPAWVRYRGRDVAFRARVFWHKKVLRLRNPYAG